MRTAVVILALALVAVLARPAHGEDDRVPERCEIFRVVHLDRTDPWSQILSFASCMQDASIAPVTTLGEVAPMVETLTHRMRPAIGVFLQVLERAPAEYQIRAAHLIGTAYIALMVRARASIPAAGPHGRVFRAALEPELAPAAQIAFTAFATLARVDHEGKIFTNARAMRDLLARDWPELVPAR